jgi:polyhydroxybutyrate depolymerase
VHDAAPGGGVGPSDLGHHHVRRPGRAGTRCVAAVLALVVFGCLTACARPERPVPPSPVAPGAALPGGLQPGSSEHTLRVGDRTRSFRVYRPASLPAGARVPLVLVIHGGGGSARGAEARYGWDAEADRAGFLVAYPDGVGHSWNGGLNGCCGAAGEAGVDDVGFLGGVIASVEATTPVDTARVDATGISEGGIMAYRLACSTHVLAAVGPDSATQIGACPDPDPVSVIHVHGTADTRIPYDGHAGAGVLHLTGGPIPAVVDHWRAVDRCPAPAVTSTPTPAGAVQVAASACPDGRAVTLVTLDGAGHQWPGSRPRGTVRDRRVPADPPSRALNATDTVWAFFAAHPRA